ncbi:MAG: site-specific DNA-methyltransferase [bacterium]|nr:site-specific DNA-methyltransferase [bacterium]
MKNIFKNKLYALLKKDSRLWDEEKKEINETLLKDLIDRLDEKLLELLLSDKESKKEFFIKVKDVYVLKHNKLKFFIDENKLDNSYTQYQNKIGLRVGNKLLSERDDVVLDWPFKDCILEGGMTKEDEKRNEIFFNEVLAKDEIDRLKDPKALVNWKRHTKKGEEKVGEIKRDKDGIIRENLIIKGNNLLALHSLKEQFTGKVKLIYIDPPYNTGSDSFAYNDNFNHSSWLTFMKNRLEIAETLLDKNGVIFISINHIELAYVSILLDDIFGSENKLPIITLKAGTTASYRSINDCPVNVTEYVLAYSKSSNFKPNPIYRETGYSEDYSHFINNHEKKSENWQLTKLTDLVHKKHGCDNWIEYKKKIGGNWKRKRFEEMEEFAFQNKNKVVSLNTLQKPSKKIQDVIDQSQKNRDKVFSVEREGAEPIYCFNGRTLAFFGSKFKEIDGEYVPAEILTNLWTDISFLGIGPEGGVTLENGKKPEYLLKTIIDLITEKNDIVLDYHAGSGTTLAVAHKTGRQYIGIEQLDYEGNNPETRLKNVVKGDQSGISKSVDWQGGDDFIYLELAKWNEEAKEKIKKAKSLNELENLFDELYERYFLNYNVKTKEFKEKTLKEEGFKKLSLDQQKKLFVEMLDMNQMYVNFSEREDKKYNLSKEDVVLSEEFYNSEK